LSKKQTNVDIWLGRETKHKRKALENASKHFDKSDSLTIHLLEAIYGQESSFGVKRRTRGIKGAAGDFQIEKITAERLGLTAEKKNDQRFDVDDSSAAAAKYLKNLDDTFSKKTTLTVKIKTIPVKNKRERIKFVIASYNAGEGRIAKAQNEALKNGKSAQKWKDVAEHLGKAGASKKKVEEVLEYVENVLEYTSEFSKKSKANKKAKNSRPSKINGSPKGGHWTTKDGRHILIR